MKKIMAINAGSSSLKFKVFNMPDESILIEGVFERIGFDAPEVSYKINGFRQKEKPPIHDHRDAADYLIEILLKNHIVDDLNEISAVGHRITHGGSDFSDSAVLNRTVIQKIENLCELAPLHNPAGLLGIRAFMKGLPKACAVAVFDTSFHQTLAPETYLYPVPLKLYNQYHIRKYGFHGTNHQYVANEAALLLEKPLKDLKIISCHLGNGSSICAIQGGKSVNTSMGFTPLAGLMMGTRSGTVDPSIIPFIMKKTGLTIDEMMDMFNKESGLLGISGISNDFRDVELAAKAHNEQAELAIKMFVNRVTECVGGYVALMGGVDAIVFTAGIGEHSASVRQAVVSNLAYLGAKLDFRSNEENGPYIHTPDSKVSLLVIPANEELMIARDTWRLSEGQAARLSEKQTVRV